MPARKRDHYRGSYAREAAEVRRRANADALTTCQRCGRTLDEHEPDRNGNRPTWDAGHVHDGQVGGPLGPEASTCNRSAGATEGNRRRRGFRTRKW